jgi:hypothetical protein
MPPKISKKDLLKRAIDELDGVLIDSPVRKKKSKPTLVEPAAAGPQPVVVVPPAATIPSPRFVETYDPEAALRLTRALDSVNFADDKINFYSDVLASFPNTANDQAIATAAKVNDKIAKWGGHRDKVQTSMDVLLKIAPKKKANAMLTAETAAGFISASG